MKINGAKLPLEVKQLLLLGDSAENQFRLVSEFGKGKWKKNVENVGVRYSTSDRQAPLRVKLNEFLQFKYFGGTVLACRVRKVEISHR